MRKTHFSSRGLVCALAVTLAVVAPGTPVLYGAARLSNAALLSGQLPDGETLASAPMKDVQAAVSSAVTKRPGAAGDIVRIALMAKMPKRGGARCGMVRGVVGAAVGAAPGEARSISEMAQSLAPGCVASIDQALRSPAAPVIGTAGGVLTTGAAVPGSTTGESTDAGTTTTLGGDFGAGFGPGFPGSPGFSGSSPSGGFALPNTNLTPVTSSTNG